MGIFSRKRREQEPAPGASASAQQVPDQLADQASVEYGNGRFQSALDRYGDAIDKLHTMTVIAAPGSRVRRPGPGDQRILDGFTASLGATLTTWPNADVTDTVERSVGYLRQIAQEAGAEAHRYVTALDEIERTYRTGRG